MSSAVATAMATRATTRKAEDLLAPLLSDDDSSTEGSDDSTSASSVSIEKRTFTDKLKSAFVYVVLTAGVATSAASFLFVQKIVVYVAGGICIANTPYAAYKEQRMSKISSLRSLNNKLREDANRLENEVDNLSKEIDFLEPEAERGKEAEIKLRAIADTQQVNVDKLVDLVNENAEILHQMRANIRQRIVQDIISIVMSSDKDGDQKISRVEAKMLALKIRLQLQEYDVEFDEQKFFKVLSVNPSVTRVINIVQKLIPADDDDEASEESDDGGVSEEEDIDFDMFHMRGELGNSLQGSMSSSSSRRGSLLPSLAKARTKSRKSLLKRG